MTGKAKSEMMIEVSRKEMADKVGEIGSRVMVVNMINSRVDIYLGIRTL